jgi:hypothetical protein
VAIHTVAGTGAEGFSGDNGAAIAAALANPLSMAADGFRSCRLTSSRTLGNALLWAQEAE